MGFLDYYKQFEGMPEEEVNARLREQAAERRRKALAVVDPIDLSATTWPEYPHPAVVNAITYTARRGLHRYLDRSAGELRSELAHRHGVPEERVVVGDGAAQLLSSAAYTLMDDHHDELVTPWPSYGLYPVMAHRARAHAVPVPGYGVDAVLSAVNDQTRLVALCSPNDPTGELVSAAELRRLLQALPERVVVLLDEALADFADEQPLDAALPLLEDFPRLLCFRSFSKAWGLAGLRVGYALGGPGSEPLLEQLAPELGVNELAQAGALEALRSTEHLVARRVERVRGERARLLLELRSREQVVATPSQTNFVWLEATGIDGAELVRRLDRAGVRVAGGGPLGDAKRLRVSIHDGAATDRFLRALDGALA
ncbi:MAG: aminotransferase class I/II-fold pyridoxal phosphate-dependent enzyme [Actinobacteria bacterium]|nr:MAG: aminotransferase class I/II-fold pyridoxal phosphate-dependent enzyme [Actinomycetota bacterium]